MKVFANSRGEDGGVGTEQVANWAGAEAANVVVRDADGSLIVV